VKLNDFVVKNLEIGTRRSVWDSTLPSFGIRINQRSATYVLKRQNRYEPIGRVGIISLKEARDEAKRRLAQRYLPQTTLPIAKAKEEFLKVKSGELRPKTMVAYTHYIKLLEKPPHQITPQYVYSIMPEGKAAANLAFSVIKSFCSWCLERGYIDQHPLLRRKQPNKLKSRDRLLTDDEVKAIWQQSYHHAHFGILVRCLLTTGQRLTQFTHLETAWIKHDHILFPGRIMKNAQEHTLPLTPLLKHQLPTSQAIYIWGDKPFSHPQNHINDLRTALPQVPLWRLHDFRRVFSSTCSKLKPRIDIDIVEAVLAHVSGSRSPIQRVYDRDTRVPQMREALERYQQHLLDIGCKST
jgi:hypothetical protein